MYRTGFFVTLFMALFAIATVCNGRSVEDDEEVDQLVSKQFRPHLRSLESVPNLPAWKREGEPDKSNIVNAAMEIVQTLEKYHVTLEDIYAAAENEVKTGETKRRGLGSSFWLNQLIWSLGKK
ncbi:unnamed protein product [Adineta ricciae]|uniref:Uncharacterized protein n=1 Tax=Adineta ricciae TaxID=249248 RepID=A0A815W0Q2_ADIRI|nr:unnamed protein product [Adineta ricciae]CAF1622804.1 unnamed protein product [Adineta ricciae]